MIEIKDAVSIAKDFVQKAYETTLPELRLEEIERSEDDKYWLITLGYIQEKSASSQLAKIINPTERIYKIVKVDAKKGKAVAMKIREV